MSFKEKIINKVKNFTKKVIENTKKFVAKVSEAAKELLSSIAEEVKSLAISIIDTIQETIKKRIDNFKKALNDKREHDYPMKIDLIKYILRELVYFVKRGIQSWEFDRMIGDLRRNNEEFTMSTIPDNDIIFDLDDDHCNGTCPATDPKNEQ